jgi:hypothetical protein
MAVHWSPIETVFANVGTGEGSGGESESKIKSVAAVVGRFIERPHGTLID